MMRMGLTGASWCPEAGSQGLLETVDTLGKPTEKLAEYAFFQ